MTKKQHRKWGPLLLLAVLQPICIWLVTSRIAPWILSLNLGPALGASAFLLFGHWCITMLCLDACEIQHETQQRIAVSLTVVTTLLVVIPSNHSIGHWLPATVLLFGMMGHVIAFVIGRQS